MDKKTAEALHCLALEGGSVTAASKALGIPKQTLHAWKTGRHREEYERIAQAHESRRDRSLADKYHAIASDRAELLESIGQEAKEALEAGNTTKLKDLGQADQNFSRTAGIVTQHDRSLRDKPLQQVEHTVNLTLVQKAIHRLEQETVDTTAVEEKPDLLPPAA